MLFYEKFLQIFHIPTTTNQRKVWLNYNFIDQLNKVDVHYLNKPKGLKVAKEDQKADRHDGR